jgi:hypothetical protein
MRQRWTFLALGVALVASSTASAAELIKPEQIAKLQTLIKPDAAEQKWEEIPWLADLWEARKLAAKQGKPILLWEMDGHPLGCT